MSDEPNEATEVVKKWMLTLANEIADQADAISDEFKHLPGDVALRTFAQGIRNTNAKSGFVPAMPKGH